MDWDAAEKALLKMQLQDVKSAPLRAMWHAAKGEWEAAHEVAQAGEDRDSAWVHAYLHREEGDEWNAAYWYRRAGRPVQRGSLPEERAAMIAELSRLHLSSE